MHTSRDRSARRRRMALAAGAILALAAGIATGARHDSADAPRAHPDKRVAKVPPPTRLAGQLVVMRFAGRRLPAYVGRALRRGETAGVILFPDNVASAEQVRALTASIRRASRGSALVCVDQEGGTVRTVPFAGPAIAQRAVESIGQSRSRAFGAARDLRALGINVNLAPVADVPSGPGPLAARAFGGGADRVAALVAAAVDGYRAGGVAPTLKHFPGLGAATRNTDDAPVTISASRDALTSGLTPFRAGIDAGAPLVMASHALYPSVDPGSIASQSRRWLDRELRGRLGFGGVVITDSLEADAVLARSGVGRAAVRSARAGADLLLTTGRGSHLPVLRALVREVRRSPAFRARAVRSIARIEALRSELRLRAAG